MKTLSSLLASAALAAGLAGCANGSFDPFNFGTRDLSSQAQAPRIYDRGKAYLEAGQLGLALQTFNRALAEEPQSVDVLNALGATYDRLGRFDLSERYYQRALLIAPSSPQTLNNLGYSYLLQGRRELALKVLERARAAEPSDPAVLANLRQANEQPTGQVFVETPLVAAALAPPPPVQARIRPRLERKSATVLELTVSPRALALQPDPKAPRSLSDLKRAAGVGGALGVPSGLATPVGTARAALQSGPTVLASATELPTLGPGGRKDKTPAVLDPNAMERIRFVELEVANGTGRERMAARMRAWLEERGISAVRITNDPSFAHRTSAISFRSGFADEAEIFRGLLPLTPAVTRIADQRSPVRLRLGGDWLDFDRKLIAKYEHERR